MNILILSAGTRNKIIQYFKKTIGGKGKVVATDMSELAPAVYEADKFYKVPRMTDDGYIEVIFDICKKENISMSKEQVYDILSSIGFGECEKLYGFKYIYEHLEMFYKFFPLLLRQHVRLRREYDKERP